ncbi:hypothetical protein [Microbacterium sp. NPDC076895]|uniref:hypothetical protein n=1 Tax=Microbacterium sp. NPDC076895 TaxID=3154957 RepID=UPI003440ECBE
MTEPQLLGLIEALQTLREAVKGHCVRPHGQAAKQALSQAHSDLLGATALIDSLAGDAAGTLAQRRETRLPQLVGVKAVHDTLVSGRTGLGSTLWRQEVEGLKTYDIQPPAVKKRTLEYRKRKYLSKRWTTRVDQDPLRSSDVVADVLRAVSKEARTASKFGANSTRITRCKQVVELVDSLLILCINAAIDRDAVFQISYALSAIPLGRVARGSAG